MTGRLDTVGIVEQKRKILQKNANSSWTEPVAYPYTDEEDVARVQDTLDELYIKYIFCASQPFLLLESAFCL